ncbi:hypothetical protein EJ03DRAFT_24625 [Teratosphaeria nubilosa]|uniref:Uncharacterized protein n=1 Tax=Teratosphaeria nubilosa TaxID=161662 RepID=A0A6G1LGQ0_9PEZI|nr:hypothetical protein EJ03DRAFT_24625 [Teratosphaeria nubilosa]
MNVVVAWAVTIHTGVITQDDRYCFEEVARLGATSDVFLLKSNAPIWSTREDAAALCGSGWSVKALCVSHRRSARYMGALSWIPLIGLPRTVHIT